MRWWGCFLILIFVNSVQAEVDDASYEIKIRGLLQGAFSHNSPHLMHDTLRQKGLIPDTQPFNDGKFAYQGTENFEPSLAEISGGDAIVDWVLVELRDPDEPSAIAAREAVLLTRSGNILETRLLTDSIVFSGLKKSRYYVALHHRNHLGTMTAEPITFTNDGLIIVDFTNPATRTNQEDDRVVLTDTLMGLQAGYVNSDERIIVSGPGNDLSEIIKTVLTAQGNNDYNANFITKGYFDSDLNMDGQSIFAGPGNDVLILVGNILSHPQNTTAASNFIIKGIQSNGSTISNLPLLLQFESQPYRFAISVGDKQPLAFTGHWDAAFQEAPYLQIINEGEHTDSPMVDTTGSQFKVATHTKDSLQVGEYDSTITLRACQDENCSVVYSNSYSVLPILLTVNKVPEWRTIQGNTSHNGYVPIWINSVTFPIKWEREIEGVNDPVAGAGIVYVTQDNSDPALIALDEESGNQLWELVPNNLSTSGFSAPGLNNNTVFFTSSRYPHERLFGIDRQTGTLKFQSEEIISELGGGSFSADESSVFLMGGNYQTLHSFSAVDGRKLWDTALVEGYSSARSIPNPVIDGENIITADESGLSLTDKTLGSTSRIMSHTCVPYCTYSQIIQGQNNNIIISIDNSPDPESPVNSFNKQSGELQWGPTGDYLRSLAVANNRVYATKYPYGSGLVALDEQTGDFLWGWSPTDLRNHFNGNLVVTKNYIFFSVGMETHAFDLEKKQIVWTHEERSQAIAITDNRTLLLKVAEPHTTSKVLAFDLN